MAYPGGMIPHRLSAGGVAYDGQYALVGTPTSAYRYYQLYVTRATTSAGTTDRTVAECMRFEVYDQSGVNQLLNKSVIGGNFLDTGNVWETIADTVNGNDWTANNGSRSSALPGSLIVDASTAFVPFSIFHSSFMSAYAALSKDFAVYASNNSDMSGAVKIFDFSEQLSDVNYASRYHTNGVNRMAPGIGLCDDESASAVNALPIQYRLKITGSSDTSNGQIRISEFELYDIDGDNILRRDDAVSCTPAARYIINTTVTPNKVVNGDRAWTSSDYYYATNVNTSAHYLSFALTYPLDKPVAGYAIFNQNNADCPTDWVLQCSHDGCTWVDLDTQTDQASAFQVYDGDETENTKFATYVGA